MKLPLIKYKIFRRRKNFDPIILFKRKNDLTYEEFVSILENKGAMSPGEPYFKKVKEHFEKTSKPEKTQEKPEVKEKKEKVVDEKPQIKQRRKRKVKNEKEDIHEEVSPERALSD